MIWIECEARMPISDYRLTELKRAYQIIGVPLEASAHTIKQAYRRLLKRWHPDLYESGTPAHSEATQMTSTINEAYSAISNAPLRYHVEASPQRMKGTTAPAGSSYKSEPPWRGPERIPNTDRIEYSVRFVCGAFFGVVVILNMAVSIMPDTLPYLAVDVLCALAVILGFGFAAARYGDKFWYSILRRWWIWR
jgi:hypothetical protein